MASTQETANSSDGSPMIGGRGSRRRMRGRSDVVERCGVQDQGVSMLVGRRDVYLRDQKNLILFRESISSTVTRS